MSFNETNNNGQAPYKKNKKKNKKAKFLKNAKGFAKRGMCGRGTHIENDDYNYFINVLDCMKTDFEEIEDKVNMANNVFEQTNSREVYLASNQIVSQVMESLLGFINADQLERCFKAFADNFRPVCSDPFASHVLQKMVEIAFLRFISKGNLKRDNEVEDTEKKEGEPPSAKRLKTNKKNFTDENYNLETEFTPEHKTNCGNFVLRVGKFMLNNLEDFVFDEHASHITGTCIFCLAGIHVPKVVFVKVANLKATQKMYEVPSEWNDICREYAERLEMWPQFSDLPYKRTSAQLLRVLCMTIKNIDTKLFKRFGKILIQALLKEDSNYETKETMEDLEETDSKLPNVFQNISSAFLLETLITESDRKLLKQIYAKLFVNKLPLLAKAPSTHFAVQRLLDSVKEKEEFENMFEELHEHIEELLKIGHTLIVTSLSSACLRLQSKQAQLVIAVQRALHINNDKERQKFFFLCLLKLKPFEIAQEDETNFVHLHGSLLIQDILRFNKPIFMVNCILETSPDDLVKVFNTPNGSHICDVFLTSKFIGEKSRDKFLKLLEGFYLDMAINKFGSRVVELCFASAQDAQKVRIVKELAQKTGLLKSTLFGGIVYTNLRVETYCLSVDQWKASLNKKESKALKLFKDITN